MWTDEMFGVKKPVIALLHLDALPGDPGFCGSMAEVVRHAAEDLNALQAGGVDGVLIANEFSLPYTPDTEYVTVAAMANVIGQLKHDISIPFGVNIVMGPMATIELAAATGAKFCRSAFTGAYAGEYGLYISGNSKPIRRKKELGLDDLKLFYKVNPESDAYLVPRDIKVVTKSILFGDFADALCVSGSHAGGEASSQLLVDVKNVAAGVPVFCNTGCSHSNVREKFAISDGACMGTAFKKDGFFKNHVDVQRVKDFMEIVRDIRAHL